MFRIKRSPQGRIFIYAPSYWVIEGKRTLMGYTFREFTGDDLADIPVAEGYPDKSAASVLAYIEAH